MGELADAPAHGELLSLVCVQLIQVHLQNALRAAGSFVYH